MSAYSDMNGVSFSLGFTPDSEIVDSIQYNSDKRAMLNKHDAELVVLQIRQLEELCALATHHKDTAAAAYYAKLIKNRRELRK